MSVARRLSRSTKTMPLWPRATGRPLAADNTAWTLYWILQAAVLLRVLAALWSAGTLATALTLAAVLAWSVATIGWALRYGGWYGRPRIDGRPG